MRERSAGAVVYRVENGKPIYLLLHYEAGHWDFPKGNIEEGEKIEETVRREVREETGISDIQLVPGFKTKIKYFFKRDGQTVFKTVDFLIAKTAEKDVKLSFEHIGFEWLPFKEAMERLTYKTAKDLLVKVDEFLAKKEKT